MIFISAASAEYDKGTAGAVMPVSKVLWKTFYCGIGFRSPQRSHFSGSADTRERARETHRRLPCIPGSRRENRRDASYSSYVVCLSGRGRACIHAGRPLCPHPCGQTRSAVNASSIFPLGAGIVKGTAIVPLTRSQAVLFQISDITKVNGTFCQRQHVIIFGSPVTTGD